ncbi:hypothetical protein C5167_041707 [Papaver somniferum]|nr:hypothetical protein C5167_041707 [Papaver somniferum]
MNISFIRMDVKMVNGLYRENHQFFVMMSQYQHLHTKFTLWFGARQSICVNKAAPKLMC